MPTETIIFDSFRGGEYGQLGASGAPPDSFTGLNVMVFLDGSIGPRPGMISLAPSGIPTGAIWGIIGIGRTVTRGIVFGVGDTVHGFTFSPLGAVGSIGTLAGTPSTKPVKMVQYGPSLAYAAVYGDKGYKIDPATPAVTALASFPACRVCGVYGERMIAANTAANPNRVYYSAAADFTSWPALNYFDVGSSWPIQHVEDARSRLAVANSGSEWWTLSGVPGVNGTLRRAPRADVSPFAPNHVARLGETLWFLPASSDFPAQFTGAVADKLRLRHLAFAGGTSELDAGNYGAAALPSSETLIFTNSDTGKALLFHNDAWSIHTLPSGVGPYVTAVSDGGVEVNRGALIFCDGGGASTAAKFYALYPTLGRPGKVSDTIAQPGDGSTTPLTANFTTAERWARNGTEMTVRSVTVDFVKWNTGAAVTNHIDLTVRNLYRTGVGGTKDSTTAEWDEAASVTTADKTPDRAVLTFGDQGPAHGFKLVFENLRGVAIRRVTVHLESTEARR